MKSIRLGLAAVVGVGLATVVASRSAEACSRPRCIPDALMPLGSGARAIIPANLPALGWSFPASRGGVTEGSVQLRRVGASPAEVPTTVAPFLGRDTLVAIRPSVPWVEGAEYTFQVSPSCEDFSSAATTARTLTVGPAVPLPTRLGTLTMGALQLQNARVLPDGYDGSCATPADIASREANLDLDPQAEPWSDHLLVELLVDGQPRGALRTGAEVPVPSRSQYDGPDRLPYAVCSGPETTEPYALREGSHRFQYRAWIIGSNTTYLSNEVEADLDCDGEGGCSASPRSASSRVTLGALAAFGMALAFRSRRRRRAMQS